MRLVLALLIVFAGCAHRVFIETEPTGASIKVDGQDSGTSPCVVKLYEGSTVAAFKQGYGSTCTTVVTDDFVLFGDPFPSSVKLTLREDGSQPTSNSTFSAASSSDHFRTHCGAPFPENSKFCGSCGAKRE
jgi:hypothetical protein